MPAKAKRKVHAAFVFIIIHSRSWPRDISRLRFTEASTNGALRFTTRVLVMVSCHPEGLFPKNENGSKGI